MILAVLILLVCYILYKEGFCYIRNSIGKYKGYYFITYTTQKIGGFPIYHQAIIKGHPVDWILKKAQENKSIYYRLLFSDNDAKYKYMSTTGGN